MKDEPYMISFSYNIPLRENIKDVFGGNEGRPLMDYLARTDKVVRKEYLIDGEWSREPDGDVIGVRYIVGDLSRFLCAGEVWRYIKYRSIETPVKSDKILEQLFSKSQYITPEKLRLFSPWGPRYGRDGSLKTKIFLSDPEITTLKEIRDIFDVLRFFGYKLDFLLMPADVYGTEINGLPKKSVQEYFERLEDVVYTMFRNDGEVTVRSWSSIREENESLYLELKTSVEDDFNTLVKDGEYQKAVEVAKYFNPNDPRKAARRYCIERLVEASLIERLYDPIKLSLVRKEKDSLDGPLKRIYIVQNRAPWLGGR